MATDDVTFGARLRMQRERAGKTRAVLGGLVGRSEEWVKAVEAGRILMPRLPMLLHIADVLGITDLAGLTGSQAVPVASITKAGHAGTAAIADAMSRAPGVLDGQPSTVGLRAQVDQAWQLWHQSSTERSTLAPILPTLLGNARATVRALDGNDRRAALAELARVYHLVQLFLAHQPAAELVWLAADRGMAAAQDADDPEAYAVAAWYYGHVYRGAAQTDQAEAVAKDGLALLDPGSGPGHLVRAGQLHLGMALGHAKVGRAGQAWREWEMAATAAAALGDSYSHPWLIFGPAAVGAYAVGIETDLVRAGEAVRRADRFAVGSLPSRTRRAAYLIDAARAHGLRREYVAVVHLLQKATRESLDTVTHSPYARMATLDLLDRGGGVRDDARELALILNLPG